MQIWGDCFGTLLCVLRLHTLSQEWALYHQGAQASCDSRNALGHCAQAILKGNLYGQVVDGCDRVCHTAFTSIDT